MIFKKKPKSELPKVPTNYPDDICLVTEKGRYYLHGGKRFKIASQEVFDSWKFPLLVHTTEAAVSQYPITGTRLSFRNGTFINNVADGRIYLVSGGKLRKIVGVGALNTLGLKPNDAISVSDSDVKNMNKGEDLK